MFGKSLRGYPFGSEFYSVEFPNGNIVTVIGQGAVDAAVRVLGSGKPSWRLEGDKLNVTVGKTTVGVWAADGSKHWMASYTHAKKNPPRKISIRRRKTSHASKRSRRKSRSRYK